MKNIIFAVATIIILAASITHSTASAAADYPCEKDSAEITSLLKELHDSGLTTDGRRALAAKALVGIPANESLASDTLDAVHDEISALTPLGFINSVQALATASALPNPTWRDYASEYRKIACRRGEDTGFASIMWHGSDWISDNIYRGNLREMTESYGDDTFKTRSLDYLTRHRDEFGALNNPATYDRVEMIEMGFRTHKIPYLKRQHITRGNVATDLREGDIIMLLSNTEGEDIHMVGYIVDTDAGKRLVALSPDRKEVVMFQESLDRLFKLLAKHFFGFRYLRWR